ncbi:MAG TPA: hypothetical protein VGR07_03525, partial [Thermoanaerobaculia bacterium]|nr:hypothetical protein [Thermoanaerobaculia bacterium]
PARVAFPVAGREPSPGTVALHFVSPRRALLGPIARALREHPPASRAEPVEVQSFAASRLTPVRLAATEARRRLARLRPR